MKEHTLPKLGYGYTINHKKINDHPLCLGTYLFIQNNKEMEDLLSCDYNTIISNARFDTINKAKFAMLSSPKLLVFKDKEVAQQFLDAYKEMINSIPSYIQKHFGLELESDVYYILETPLKKLKKTAKYGSYVII